MSLIGGDKLLGFEDFFSDGVSDRETGAHGQADGIAIGQDGQSHGVEIGAAPARRLPVMRTAPTAGAKAPTKGVPSLKALSALKGKIKPRKAGKGKPSPHKAALANAAKAGKHALTVSKTVTSAAAKYKQGVASGKHAPPVKLTALGFTRDGTCVLGIANPKLAKTLTPKQRMAVQKQAQAAARLSAAQKAAAAAAVAAQKKGQAALDFVKQAIPVVKKALVVQPIAGRGTAVGHVLGYVQARGGVDALSDDEVVELSTLIGSDVMTQAGMPAIPSGWPGAYEGSVSGSLSGPVLDPSTGQMIDPSTGMPVDPTTGMPMSGGSTPGLASVDSGTGQVLGPDGSVLYDPSSDPAVIPMPARGQALTQDELMEVWQNVPDDGFVYAASEGGTQYPPNSVGSVNAFLGSPKNANGWAPGLIFGGTDWLGPSPDDPNTFWHSSWPSTTAIQQRSIELGWGPLIGNPQGQLANLQYAVADKKWFWQGKSAPVSYSAEADSKIAQANAATIAANRAAAVAQAKQMQADAFARQEAQAQQDAQNALAESQAQTQSDVAAQQLQSQQGQLDLQTQQTQLQEEQQASQVQTQAQQAMIQQAQQQAKIQASAQQSLIDQANTWNAWAQQHPDEAAAQLMASDMSQQPAAQGPMSGADDGGGDDGGDDGGGDDSGYPTDDDLLLSDATDDSTDFDFGNE